MAKPRIFVSSTYYDLKHIRNNLESFICQFGYEPVLFESGDIPFDHTLPLDESCYSEIDSCHILVLIIGGRYGSPISEESGKREKIDDIFKSITKKEYETARSKDIPIYIFVEKAVMAEYRTYKENKGNSSINYAHVDSPGVFKLLDNIMIQGRNNYTREFEKFDDISTWLTDQWAGLFADFLSKKSSDFQLKNLSEQIDEVKQLTDVLKEYNESIMTKISPDNSKKLIKDSELKLQKLAAERFSKEPIIQFFSANIPSNKPLSEVDIFRKFHRKNDFLAFAKSIGVPQKAYSHIKLTEDESWAKLHSMIKENYPMP